MQALRRSNHNVLLDFTRTSELVKKIKENLQRIIYDREKKTRNSIEQETADAIK